MPTANEPSRLGSRQFQKPQLRSPRISFALALCCIFFVFAMYSRSLDFQFVLDDHRFTAEPTPSREFHAAEIWISWAWFPESFSCKRQSWPGNSRAKCIV